MATQQISVIDGPVVDAGDPPASPPTPGGAVGGRWLPVALALVAFAVMSALVLSQAEKLIEPDPYAYRASIAALEDGNLTLTQEQYDALSTQLASTDLGGGIQQWHQNADGQWVSEKNPGYPFLAVGFDAVGAMRLAPLFYGALGCLGLWFGGRRWLGRWGGTFAVGAYCSAAVVMVMAWRSTMPTFTDASLVALGIGLMVWTVLAVERSSRARTIVGALAFFSLGLAFLVRYTNIAVLAVTALFAVLICLRPRFGLWWTVLPWWALAAGPPIVAGLAYNAAVFDGPFSTGYVASTVQFGLSAIPDNLRLMPAHLWRSMPVFVVGLAAIVGIAIVQLVAVVRTRRDVVVVADPTATPAPVESVVTGSTGTPTEDSMVEPVPVLMADRWVGLFLVAAWASVWALYAAYEWTAQMGGGGGGPFGGGGGGFGGGGPFADGGATYSIVRFYLPALGAIALLVAWLLVRLPLVLGVLALVVLFVAGGAGFLSTVDSQWAGMFSGGFGGAGAGGFPGGAPAGGAGAVPGGAGGGGMPDLSNCPNLPTRPDGFQPPAGADGGAGTPPAGTPGAGSAGGPPVGLTFDENGCPVFADPGASTGAAPDASTG